MTGGGRGARERERERALPAKTIVSQNHCIRVIFFLHKNTKVCNEYMLRAAYFSQTCFGLYFAAFCWYWTTLASTWPP